MYKILLAKFRYYKKSYFLKSILLFLLFASLQIVGIIACNFSIELYRFTSFVNDDYYYSTVSTDRDGILENVRDNFNEDEYVAFHHFTSYIEDNNLTYITYYEGNVFLGGYSGDRFSFEISGNEASDSSVLVTENYKEDTVEYLGNTYSVTGTIKVEFPRYVQSEYDIMGLRDVRFIFIKKPAEIDPETDSYNLYSFTFNTVKDSSYFLANYISKGSSLTSNFDFIFESISALFFAVFLVPYIVGLIFWSFLLSLLDTITKRELSIFRVFGYNKKRAKRLYFFENIFLTFPGIILSEIIFIPIFIFAFNATIFLPLLLGGVALIYYLIYSLIYSSIITNKIYRGYLL